MGNNGFLVTFEGTEGVGKSTLIRKVSSRLKKKGRTVTVSREPGGSALSEKIRDLLLSKTMNRWTELFLYEAARSEHTKRVLYPAVQAGNVVLCDRYTDSSLAYQAHARGLNWKKVNYLNDLATDGLRPSLTVLLDLDPTIGLSRVKNKNRFEREGVQFLKKVRQGFLRARRSNPKRWLVLDPLGKTPDELAEVVVSAIEKKLGRRKRGA